MPGPISEQIGTLIGKAQRQMDAVEALTGLDRMLKRLSKQELETLSILLAGHTSTAPSAFLADKIVELLKNDR